MVDKELTIEIGPGGSLAEQIGEADEAPTVLIVNGIRYVLCPEDTPTPAALRDDEDTRRFLANLERRRAEHPDEGGWEGYDPECARKVLAEFAGTLSDEEADRWIDEIYRARLEGSRPFMCPEPPPVLTLGSHRYVLDRAAQK